MGEGRRLSVEGRRDAEVRTGAEPVVPCAGAGYAPAVSGVLTCAGCALALDAPDLLIFDIDGVLLDTAQSYPAAVEAAVRWFCRERLGRAVTDDPAPAPDLAAWKAAGGFNDDWQLAQGICLYLTWHHLRGDWPPDAGAEAALCAAIPLRGGGLTAVRALCPGADACGAWDAEAIARVCMERYGGDDACEAMFGMRPTEGVGPGLWHHERALVPASALEAWRGHLGVYTGRNSAEASLGLRAAGLDALFPLQMRQTSDAGLRKPDPAGLIALAERGAPRLLLFAGDTPDDAATVHRYRAVAARMGGMPPAIFAGVLGGAPGVLGEDLFRSASAEIIATDAHALLRYLRPPAMTAGR